jgi:hypothetical protein
MDARVELSRISKTKGLLTQHVGSETLLYNEQTHQAFCLNPVAAQVWHLLDGAGTVPQIASAATRALETQVDDDMVLFALAEFRRDGLIDVDEPTGTLPMMDRRHLLQKLGVGTAMMLPVVAAIMAPKAAQAYNGCVDCTTEGDGEDATPGASKNTSRQEQDQQGRQKNTPTQNGSSDYHPLFVP